MNICKIKRSTQIAIMTGAGSGAVEKTATGTTPLTLSDSVAGTILGITVNGHSEVVEGEIKSVGEGWATVDLGTLTWSYSDTRIAFNTPLSNIANGESEKIKIICSKYQTTATVGSASDVSNIPNMSICQQKDNKQIFIKNTAYTDPTAFQTAMSGVLLCYQLADPSQGNTLAIKTDDGSGIDGTMAVFTTGTPLRGIPNTDVRDVMQWDGSSGEVMNNCVSVDLSTSEVTWNLQETYDNRKLYYVHLGATVDYSANYLPEGNFTRYDSASQLTEPYRTATSMRFDALYVTIPIDADISIMDGIHFLMKLATPTVTPLTDAEVAALSALRTYDPTTTISVTDNPSITVKYMGKRATRTAPKKRTSRKKK